MTTDRTVRLAPAQLALKLACRDAVKAAGGQEFVEAETGRTQSRISDWCSPNTTAFMPIDVVARVEALGAGSPGHPHVTRALARAQGAAVTEPVAAGAAAGQHVSQWLAQVAGESGDLLRALASGVVLPGKALAIVADMPVETRRAVARELDQLIDVLAGLNGVLQREPNSS